MSIDKIRDFIRPMCIKMDLYVTKYSDYARNTVKDAINCPNDSWDYLNEYEKDVIITHLIIHGPTNFFHYDDATYAFWLGVVHKDMDQDFFRKLKELDIFLSTTEPGDSQPSGWFNWKSEEEYDYESIVFEKF